MRLFRDLNEVEIPKQRWCAMEGLGIGWGGYLLDDAPRDALRAEAYDATLT